VTAHDAVLFDLDGVLVDSRVPFARSVNGALAAHGIAPRPEAELHRFIGPPLHETFATLLGDRALVQSCVDAYRERYRAHAAGETLVFAGIPELLGELAGECELVVATSKPRPMAEPLLEALGLRAHFAAVVGPDLAAEHETKTVTVGRALAGLAPGARAAMVGDREYDMHAARAHAIRGIGVLWGIGSADELRDAGADALVGTPTELGHALRQATALR
jgi:phosphoglycolate phosphatase